MTWPSFSLADQSRVASNLGACHAPQFPLAEDSLLRIVLKAVLPSLGWAPG